MAKNCCCVTVNSSVTTDGVTITGNGTPGDPLVAPGGGGGGVADGITITGSGTILDPFVADFIDIRAFGGSDDGITDNTPALIAAKASVPTNALIWFKKRDTGVYYFNNTGSTDYFTNTQIYCEKDVALKFANEIDQTLNSVTPVTVILESLNNQDQYYYPQDPAITRVDTESIRENIVIREAVDNALFTEFGTDAWPAGTSYTSYPTKLTTIASNGISIDLTGYSTATFRNAVINAIPGATLSACSRGSSPLWASMFVSNSWGYAVCYEGFTIQIRKLSDTGSAIYNQQLGVNREISGGLNGNYLNYRTDFAVCSIHIHEDGKTFEFLHNGVNRNNQQVTLGGLPIEKWGFGSYSLNGSVEWYDFILEYKRKPAPFEPDTIQIFGDSQVGPFMNTSWIKYFEQYLNYSYGNRVGTIENYAVSGQTVEQQETIFNSVTHKGVSIILAGTNNIQGQGDIGTMISSLDNMLNALNYSNDLAGATVGVQIPGNKRFIVCIPPMYFSYPLNGNKGKASVNYELGGAYRMAILRWAAENNVMVVDLMSTFGTTTSYSEIMRDDIHPSDLGYALIGREIAKKYIALTSNVNSNTLVLGDSRDTLHFIKDSTAPSNTTTPVKWVNVYQGGVLYKMPIYQ